MNNRPIPLSKYQRSRSLAEVMHSTPCPACGHYVAISFYAGGLQPLTTLAWPKTTEEAQSMERLPHSFVRCVDCGHVYNKDFTYEKVPYSDKPNLMYNQGALWKDHLATTCKLLAERLPKNPTVIEIGCGEGHFLRALAALRPEGRYIGFDPNAAIETGDGCIESRAMLFDPAVHMAEYKPDLIISRHVLEHLNNPLGFVQSLAFAADWEGTQTHLFIEVPCIDRVFESGRTVDFFYEHNSHFTQESLRRLLARCTQQVELVERGYDDEVVYGLAALGVNASRKVIANEALTFHDKARAADERMKDQLDALAKTGQRIAVWGGTGKSAAFINRYGVDAERFPLVVDSDYDKAGTYVPGMGQRIETPEVLSGKPVDTILITTQWRAQDIAMEIEQRGIVCKQLLLEYQGELVDFHHGRHPYRRLPQLFPTSISF